VSEAPLTIALAGHANVGKTSLVSALTRDASLRVAEDAGTTTEHYVKTFSIAGTPVLGFVDTPGFARASRINKWLDERGGTGSQRLDGRSAIELFLDDPDVPAVHAPEKEALRGVLEAQVIAYVADVTEDPQGQNVQEIRLLRRAGVPMIAVLNYLHQDEAAPETWREVFNREGIDAIVRLDAKSFPADQERAFYNALRVLKPEHAEAFDRINSLRATLHDQNLRKSAVVVAEMLVDSLSFRHVTTHPDADEAKRYRSAANKRFKETLRAREQQCFEELASIYGHGATSIEGSSLEVQSWSGEVTDDLFDAEAIKRYGVSAGTLAAIGAVTGSLIDGVGGLGFGTVLGGSLGLAAGLLIGRRVSTRVDGDTLTVGPVDAVQFPSVLLNRSLECWRQLAVRSHANRDMVQIKATEPARLDTGGVRALNKHARKCSRRAEWSRIGGSSVPPERGAAVTGLAEVAEELLRKQLDSDGPG